MNHLRKFCKLIGGKAVILKKPQRATCDTGGKDRIQHFRVLSSHHIFLLHMQTAPMQPFQDCFWSWIYINIFHKVSLDYLVCLAVSELLKYIKAKNSLLGIVILLVCEVSLPRLVLLTTVISPAIIGSPPPPQKKKNVDLSTLKEFKKFKRTKIFWLLLTHISLYTSGWCRWLRWCSHPHICSQRLLGQDPDSQPSVRCKESPWLHISLLYYFSDLPGKICFCSNSLTMLPIFYKILLIIIKPFRKQGERWGEGTPIEFT